LKNIKNYEQFLNEELKVLKGPSDDETFDALKDKSASRIYADCLNFNLGEKYFDLAVDKGLLDGLTDVEVLNKAMYVGSLKYVKNVIEKGININSTLQYERSILMTACSKGYTDIVEYLIEKGANINKKTKAGNTALIYSIGENGLEIVKLLVEHGAKINDQDSEGNCALNYAAERGLLDIIKYLVEHGANTNLRDTIKGYTSLLQAVWEGHFEIVKYLVEHGADVTIKNENGKNAYDIAVIKNFGKIADYLKEKNVPE
jgi:ankyrin repeat protein